MCKNRKLSSKGNSVTRIASKLVKQDWDVGIHMNGLQSLSINKKKRI